MLIKGLMVEGIGCFATAAHIDGFDQGVNILAAGNEAGKSTFFAQFVPVSFLGTTARAKT